MASPQSQQNSRICSQAKVGQINNDLCYFGKRE